MSLPLIILAAVSIVAGFIPFGHFVTWNHEAYDIHIEWLSIAVPSLVIAIGAILLATVMYRKKNSLPDKVAAVWPGLWRAAHRRFYWDEMYMWVTHKVIFGVICSSIAWFDRHIIDGTMDMFAKMTQKTSYAIRGFQSGNIQAYVWWYFIGAAALAAVTIWSVL